MVNEDLLQTNNLLSISDSRRILGETSKTMTDEQVVELQRYFEVLSDLIIDQYLDIRAKARNEYENNLSRP